jgi:hypothetical protein
MSKLKVEKYIENGEQVNLIVRGVFKEWLVCTDKQVYIIKKGFMTGHLFGHGIFKYRFSRLNSVNIDLGLFWGHIELATAGIQHHKVGWPNTEDNYIVIHKGKMKREFDQVCEFINEKITEIENEATQQVVSNQSNTHD